MKNAFNKIITRSRTCSALMLLAVAVTSCGKFDNLDADDFNFFSDDKKELAELRRYETPGMSAQPLIEFIVDKDNKFSTEYEGHLRKVCDYTKLPYLAVDLKTWNASPMIAKSARTICIVETAKLNQASLDKLTEFVSTGGTLFLPYSGEDRRIGFLAGFRSDAEFETNVTAKGFLFRVPLLPNMKDQVYRTDAAHFGYAKECFLPGTRILAVASNQPDYPLVTENRIGKGKVIYFNSSLYLEKIERGLLFTGVLKGLEGIPYPIANTSTIFLDDFPSPVYDIKSEPIKSELDLTVTDFVKNVWWPDMVDIAKKYKISYSAMICFDYKNKVDPPFIFDQWDQHKVKVNRKSVVLSQFLAKDAEKKGHELCLHGYNHVEFAHGLWKNPRFIGTALEAVQKKWSLSGFGELPVTYVPPSNIIDKNGVNYLKSGMPSIKYLCSVYLGEQPEGGDREFDFDPFNKDIFDYPRICDGFYLTDDQKFSRESLYLYTGIWTHFVHPDDVFQIVSKENISQGDFDLRNSRNLGWRKTNGKNIGMLTEFDAYLKHITTAFPQMRFVNAGEGGTIVNDWRASKFLHKTGDGYYTVEELNPEQSLSDKQYWFMYGSFENAAKLEAKLKSQDAEFSKTPFLDGYLYSVFTGKSQLTLRDLQFKTPAQQIAVRNMSKKVLADYRRYAASVAKFNAGGSDVPEVDDSEKKHNDEMIALRQKMISEPKIDSVTWNKYAKYMGWEDRGNEVWKMLEEYCVKHPQAQNIMYSKELSKLIDYPNDLSREKWLSAQMLVTPNDKELLNSYVASYYTPENQEKIKSALVNLLKVDTSFDTYLMYVQHLLTYDPPAAIEELKDKKPTAEFKPAATDITWLYANDGQYLKAYEWSQLSDEIDFASKMSWLMETKSYKILEADYKKYIAANPNDYQAKATMSNVYFETGRFKDAWILATSLPESPQKDELRKMLNKDVMYVEEDLQQDLLANHPELFLPEVRDELTKTFRKEKGDFIALTSSAETNKNDASAFKNVLSYNFHDKKGNLHGIAATYSTMYKVNVVVKDGDNVTHAVGGLQYQYNNPKDPDKLQYWGRARAEYSDHKKFFYQFGAGANLSRAKSYKSAEFKIFPAETGPAHTKGIYRMQLNVYTDYYFLKYFNASVSLEGNYYTESKGNPLVTIDKSYEGSVTTKLLLDDGKEKKSRFLPFIEGSYSQASVGEAYYNPSMGYPYWMIDERLYGGGGLGWKYGLSTDNLNARVEAAYFADDYSKEFERYTGEITYQLFDYTQINATFEVYAQSKFYSNAILFGVKYNLKKRQKK
jgi:hypothetical protein